VDIASLIKSLSDFGGLGIVIAFLIWWNVRCDRQREKSYEAHLAEKRLEDERRLAYDKERLAMDRELSASLQALTSAIQARGR
jgi:hypothetical protein